MLIKADARFIPLRARVVQCCVTSPPYWGLRDYSLESSVWDGDPACEHRWEYRVSASATNHIGKQRWQHTRNGRDELQPPEKRVGWKRESIEHGEFCRCGAWRGVLGLEPTPDLYVAHIVDIFREVWRVLRDDGTLWINLGDTWATGAGKVSECPGGGPKGEKFKSHFGKHSPGSQPRMRGYTQPNRMPIPGLRAKNLVGIPWRVALALQSDGWILRSDIIWHKPNAMPQSATDRPTRNHDYIFLLVKRARYYYDRQAIAEEQEESERRRRLKEQKAGLSTIYNLSRDSLRGQHKQSDKGCARSVEARQKLAERGTKNRRTVWTFPVKPGKGRHFATFPQELPHRCILAGSRPGDVVLDPFVGTGTTVMVARELGRNGIGLDLAYQDVAAKRVAGSLFKSVVNSAWSSAAHIILGRS